MCFNSAKQGEQRTYLYISLGHPPSQYIFRSHCWFVWCPGSHIHTNVNNAIEEGHNVQMCASVIFVGEDKPMKRVFFAVYGNSCCNQYMERVRQSNQLTIQIQDILKTMPKWWHSIYPSHPTEAVGRTGELLISQVSMDKHTQVSFLMECICKLETVNEPFGFYRTIESCHVVGWLLAFLFWGMPLVGVLERRFEKMKNVCCFRWRNTRNTNRNKWLCPWPKTSTTNHNTALGFTRGCPPWFRIGGTADALRRTRAIYVVRAVYMV